MQKTQIKAGPVVPTQITFSLEGHTEQPGYRRVVVLNGKRLAKDFPSLDVRAEEFAWGYGGTGPHELARAVLAELVGVNFTYNHPEVVHNLVAEVISQLSEVDTPFAWHGTFTITPS